MKIGTIVRQSQYFKATSFDGPAKHELGEVVYVDGRHVRVCWDQAGHMWFDESSLVEVQL